MATTIERKGWFIISGPLGIHSFFCNEWAELRDEPGQIPSFTTSWTKAYCWQTQGAALAAADEWELWDKYAISVRYFEFPVRGCP